MVDCSRRMQDYVSAIATHCYRAFSFSATPATDLIGKLGKPLVLGIVPFTSSGIIVMSLIAG